MAAEPERRSWAFCKEPEIRWNLGAGVVAIWEVAPAPDPFLDINCFAKFTES